MSGTLNITGYQGQVWNNALQTLNYYNQNIDSNNLVTAQTLTKFTASSLKNALSLFTANQDMIQIYNAYLLLSEAFAVPVTIDATDAAYIQNRLNGMLAFAGNQMRFQPTLTPPSTAANANTLPIPAPGYVEYIMTFDGEVAPSGFNVGLLTTENGYVLTTESGFQFITALVLQTLIDAATAAANAWGVLANALLTSGQQYNAAAYQAVLDMQQASLVVVQNFVSANISVAQSTQQTWNSLVAVPTYLTLSSLLGNDPTSSQNQNLNTARYVLGTTLQSLNEALVVLRQQISGNIQLTTVRQNENLMDISARALGNFEQWVDIATINNLQPPYIANTYAPNVAIPGQQIFLPTTGTVQAQGSTPVYALNYLGVDIYYGPMNEDMLPWIGDLNTISGYNNLSFSLGRRLQTTYGDLIYHTDFGSRIPPEIGKIATGNELSLITAFTTSCLLSDPRVNKVTNVASQAYQNYAISVSATVIPNGLNGQSGININEVIA